MKKLGFLSNQSDLRRIILHMELKEFCNKGIS